MAWCVAQTLVNDINYNREAKRRLRRDSNCWSRNQATQLAALPSVLPFFTIPDWQVRRLSLHAVAKRKRRSSVAPPTALPARSATPKRLLCM